MEFEYFKTLSCEDVGEDDLKIEGYDFIYEPTEKDLKEETINAVCDAYFEDLMRTLTVSERIKLKSGLKMFTDDNNNWELLFNDFEEVLHEAFEKEALKGEDL